VGRVEEVRFLMDSTVLVLLVLGGLLVFFGFVYLATEADLTESIRNWFVKAVEDSTQDLQKATKSGTICKYNRLRRFIGRILQCQPCAGAWCAFPAVALTVGFGFALAYHVWWAVVVLAVPATPLTGTAVMWLAERFSPTVAADRVVDALVDVAKEALTVAEQALNKPKE